MSTSKQAYPFRWRVMDAIENTASALWPSSFAKALPYLMLLPAVLLVLLLVIGMVQIGESSAHVLDRSTFMPSDYYTAANFQTIFTQPLYWTILAEPAGFGDRHASVPDLCVSLQLSDGANPIALSA